MTKKIIEKELRNLITQGNSGIAALYAPWGNGKTYFWKKFIQKLSKDHSHDALKDLRYSYISLFGLSSLNEIRNKIFENIVSLDKIGKINPVQEYIENIAKNYSFLDRKSFRWLLKLRAKVPYVYFAYDVSTAISDLSVRDMLICVDDFERKSKNISTGEILGYLNNLKEEFNCTIVIIFNQDKLCTEEKDEFEKFNEKVIDINLSFDLSTKDLLDLLDQKDHPVYQHVCKYVNKIGCKNLRIISKIHQLSMRLSSILEGFDDEVVEIFIKSACLFCYCKLNNDENIPDTDFLLNIITYYNQDARKKLGEKYPFYMIFVQNYDFKITQGYDKLILEGVERGFFDEEKLTEEARIISEQIKSDFKRSQIAEIWSLINGSFDDNATEITDKMVSVFKANIAHTTIYDIDGAAELLKALNKPNMAREVIDSYIAHHQKNNRCINLNDLRLEIKNNHLIKAITSMESKEQKIELSQVIEDRINKQTWNDKDLKYLAGLDWVEYVEYFKSLNGETLFTTIRNLLKFDSISPKNDLYQEISNKVRNSLLDIANENDINKFRVNAMLGINEER